jgi:hypothetical protein
MGRIDPPGLSSRSESRRCADSPPRSCCSAPRFSRPRRRRHGSALPAALLRARGLPGASGLARRPRHDAACRIRGCRRARRLAAALPRPARAGRARLSRTARGRATPRRCPIACRSSTTCSRTPRDLRVHARKLGNSVDSAHARVAQKASAKEAPSLYLGLISDRSADRGVGFGVRCSRRRRRERPARRRARGDRRASGGRGQARARG